MSYHEIDIHAVKNSVEIDVENVTSSRGPRGPRGSEADIAAHEAAIDPHAAAKYAIVNQLGLGTGRSIYVQLQGDEAPTNPVDGDILIREI